jgi:guanylate kinase
MKPLLVLVGHSGVGKDRLLAALLAEHASMRYPVGYTTRPMRSNETKDVSYHFVTREEFTRKKSAGDFIEDIVIHDNMYGLDKQSVMEIQHAGLQCILILDPHGYTQFRALGYDVRVALIQAPSLDVVRQRLALRGTDDAATIEKRMQTAQREVAYYATHEVDFDVTIVNDDFDTAYAQLKRWIQSHAASAATSVSSPTVVKQSFSLLSETTPHTHEDDRACRWRHIHADVSDWLQNSAYVRSVLKDENTLLYTVVFEKPPRESFPIMADTALPYTSFRTINTLDHFSSELGTNEHLMLVAFLLICAPVDYTTRLDSIQWERLPSARILTYTTPDKIWKSLAVHV